jgi:acyl-CoA thioesterase FadM
MIAERSDKVYLSHTDASGVLYFGAPAQWLMQSASDLLVSIGLVLPRPDGFSTPARALTIEYLKPMVAHDEFVQRTYVASVGRTSFTMRHEFWVEGELRMRAEMTHVCLSLVTREKQPVLPEIRAALIEGPDLALETMWRKTLAEAGLSCGPDDLRMLRATDQVVGPLLDGLARYDLRGVAPEAVLDYGRAPVA